MFVAMSRFRVANGLEEEVDKAFQQRPHLGMPKGLKLERGHTEVRYFTHVCT